MALTLVQHDNMMTGAPNLLSRFRAARDVVANTVIAEAANTANHAERLAWATKIKNDYTADLLKEYSWCLTHWEIQALGDPLTQVTDDHLKNAVSNTLPTLAGY